MSTEEAEEFNEESIVNEIESHEEQSDSPDIEAQAREQGWVPPEEFSGDNPVSAQEFLDRGKNILPIVNARLKKTEERESKLIETVDGMKKTFEEYREFSMSQIKEAEKKGYEEAKAKYENQIQEATEEYDLEKLNDAHNKLRDLELQKKPSEEPATSQQQPGELHPLETQWSQAPENEWFRTDPDLALIASNAYMNASKANPGDIAGNLKIAEDYVRQAFPSKFATRPAHSPVSGGGNSTLQHGGGGSKNFASLPASAKKIFNEIKRMSGDSSMSEADYAKHYYSK